MDYDGIDASTLGRILIRNAQIKDFAALASLVLLH